jgi:hypothetical protein
VKYQFGAIKELIYNQISEKSKAPAVISTLKKEYLNYAVMMVPYAELGGRFGPLNESEPVAKTKIFVDNVSATDSDLVGKTGAEGTFEKSLISPEMRLEIQFL